MAVELIRGHCPAVAADDVRLLATGWDNTVYLVDQVWVFRFPRRQIAIPGVEREMRVLPLVAPQLRTPVPHPLHLGRPTDRFPWPFWGAAHITGTELAAGSNQRDELGAEVGDFLRSLHDLPIDTSWDLPYDPMRRADSAHRAQLIRVRLDRLVRSGVPVEGLDRIDQLLGEDAPTPPSLASVLTHGDLHIRHILVDDAGRLAGVIDWGDVCVADPAVDLSVAFLAFTNAARDALFDAYGPITAGQEKRARVLAVSLAAALADQAAHDRIDWLRDAALAALNTAVS